MFKLWRMIRSKLHFRPRDRGFDLAYRLLLRGTTSGGDTRDLKNLCKFSPLRILILKLLYQILLMLYTRFFINEWLMIMIVVITFYNYKRRIILFITIDQGFDFFLQGWFAALFPISLILFFDLSSVLRRFRLILDLQRVCQSFFISLDCTKAASTQLIPAWLT